MKQPEIAATATVLGGAVVVGDVQLGEGASVWYNAVLRGDVGSIRIGAGSNVQDACVLHAEAGGTLTLGPDVTVGHGCILHGCTIGEGSLIGMGSIVLDGAKIGKGCVIGAGSLVTQNTVMLDGTMAFGQPAKVVRPTTEQERQDALAAARDYAARAKAMAGGA